MNKTYHFISGLPRSGSTLLSAILKQNPKFTAGISDPLQMYAHGIIRDTNTAVGMEAAVPVQKRREMIQGLFDIFYKDGNEVCFNTNRGWSADTALLNDLFPGFKMIVCLRDIPWILDSFEQLNSKNPYTIKPLYHHQDLSNVHDRCRMLMGEIPNFGGHVHGPLINVQQSMFSNERAQICYIEYEQLVKNPKYSMQQIYQFLQEPWFEHDFDSVEDNYDEFDIQTKIKGLHDVRRKVEFKDRTSTLPGELWEKYSPMSFWKHANFSQRAQLNWISDIHRSATIKKTIPVAHRQL